MSGLRAVIVGAGLMGRWHAHSVRKAGSQVVAIVDPKSSAAAALQRRFSRARVFTDLADCLTACPADVVHVCTPLASHVRLAETALRAGKAVLLEKPVAASLLETQRLIRLARSQNASLNPVHQFTFQRGFRRLQQKRARLGDPVRVSFHLCSAGGAGRTDAERRALLLEILPHPLSVLAALFGKGFGRNSWRIPRFTCQDLEILGNVKDTLVEILLSLRGRPPRNELTVVGTGGTGRVDFFHGYSFIESGEGSRRSKILLPFRSGLSHLLAAGGNLIHRAVRGETAYPGLRELIRTFYRSIAEKHAAPISDEEILEIAAFLDRIALLMRSDTPLYDSTLPDLNSPSISPANT